MAAIKPLTQRYQHVGRAWTLWSPYGMRDGFNVVQGTRKVTHDILSVCLLRRGDNPLHPDLGMAPEIFEPLAGYAPQFWIWHAEQDIIRWVPGLESLQVDIVDFQDRDNAITTVIRFVPKVEPDINVLTFGYYEYQGAIWHQGVDSFLDGIQLNGERFRLTR